MNAQASIRPLHRATVTIAPTRSLDELIKVHVIRGLVFVGEQSCPYDEEFDGNDLSATHLLAEVDGEPAGTLRLRWFADFAKAERAAVRREYRQLGLCRQMTDLAADIAARKGYAMLYGSAQVGVLDYWLSVGFERLGKPRFHFSDHEYVPIVRRLQPSAERLASHTPDLVLNRPEGAWDRPGVLDRSVERSRGQEVEAATAEVRRG